MSLPDGSVILIEQVLDLCFGEQSIPSEKGKAKLAFILAHEIQHFVGQHPLEQYVETVRIEQGVGVFNRQACRR